MLRNKKETPLGILTKTMFISTTIRDENPIHSFPFDDQELQVELLLPESCNPQDCDYNRFFIPINVSVDNAHMLLAWSYHEPTTHTTKPRGKTQSLLCSFRISRNYFSYVINFLVIMFS